MSSFPAQFGIISAYGRQQIFETGTLPDPVQGPTWVGSLRDNALHDPFNIIFSAQLNIVTGTTGIEESLWINELFPWHYLIFIPVFVLTFTRILERVEVSTFNAADSAILAGFILFPMASRPLLAFQGFNARNTVALALFHLILVLILLDTTSPRGTDKRRILIYCVLVAGLVPSHHTWAYYLLAILSAMGVVGILRRSNRMRRYSLYGIFIWLCSATYIATNQILESGRLLVAFSTQLDNLSGLFRPTASAEVSPEYLAPFPPIWTPLQIINSLAIAFLFVISGVIFIHRYYNNSTNPIDNGFGVIFLAQSAVAGGLFVWSGLGGLRARLFEVSIPISRLLIGYLLITINNSKIKRGIQTLGIVAIIICLLSITIYPVSHSNQISHTEAAGIKAVSNHTPSGQAVFSDYRLSPSFMLYGINEIHTVDSRTMSTNKTEKLLDDVYYQGGNPANSLDDSIGKSEYTVYITKRQTNVGILDVTLTKFRSADSSIDTRWSQSKQFDRVYSNGEGIAYHRQDNISRGTV